MKFYQKRGFALVVLILAILGASVYGISKKPASLPEVSHYNWICDQAGLLTQDARQTIQEYNTAWNKKYYAVAAVAARGNIRRGRPAWEPWTISAAGSPRTTPGSWGPSGAWEPTTCSCCW